MSTIDEAKINALIAEKTKLDLEGEKLRKETEEIKERMNQKWYVIRLVSVIQAVVGGIIAAALIWSFSLEHIVKLYTLRTELKEENLRLSTAQEKLGEENKKLSTAQNELKVENAKLLTNLEESRIGINQRQNQNNEFQKQIADLRQQLGDLKQTSSKQSCQQVQENITKAKESLKTIADTASLNNNVLSASINSLSAIQANISPSTEENWFPVVSSMYDASRLPNKLQELKEALKKEKISYEINVYRAKDSSGKAVYAITLGGYLKKDEASKRVNEAKAHNIESGAYIWSSKFWGNDLGGQFTH